MSSHKHSSTLYDHELMRYSRQILLPGFDVAGQLRLKAARVLVVGAGGLGCPVVLYLAGAGVGQITVADSDTVELPNLQRQIAFTGDDLGRSKARTLAAAARAINPEVSVLAHDQHLNEDTLPELVSQADLVVDATDNFTSRFAINRACVASRVPLVSGAAIRAEGQVMVFDARQPETPCYQCLYADLGDEALNCSQAGVLGPLVGMIGATQAMEALKVIAGIGKPLVGRLLLLDAMTMQWREMAVPRDPACTLCGAGH